MNGDDLCFASAAELGALIRGRRVSPVEVVDALLSRIEKLDPTLRAYITVDADGARAAARAAEVEIAAGGYRGPLHGVPVGYKDIIDVRGLPTTAGSRLTDRSPAKRDAVVAARLRQAGAIAIGKLNTTEFAAGTMEVFGDARNPWDLSRTTGGSSAGGGAALAAGLVPLAIGTDTGGSIRIPSSFCGVAGLKPTSGRIEAGGIVPLSRTLDCPGPMARTVGDLGLALAELAGPDDDAGHYESALRRDLRGVVIGRPRRFYGEGADRDVADATERFIAVARTLGASVVDVDIAFAEESGAAFWAIAYSEAFAFHRRNVRARFSEFTAPFGERLVAAACLSAADLLTAQSLKDALTDAFAEVLRRADVLVAATTPTAALPLGQSINHADRNRFTRPANVSGVPAVAVPCGFNADGLPLSVQLMGRPWDDEGLLRIASALEGELAQERRAPIGPASSAAAMPGPPPAAPAVAEADLETVVRVAASLGVALDESPARRVAAQWTMCRDVLDRARSMLPVSG